MSPARIFALTSLTMIAFAGNSLLCRIALKNTGIDAASFTIIRLLSGAMMLWIIVRMKHGLPAGKGSWLSALALFTYAACFSFAYLSLTAATGALLLFGAVQVTMISHGLWAGERLDLIQFMGILVASGGLVGLLLPGLSAPPLTGSILMLGAGIAWGIYSLRGKGVGDPIKRTAGNFLRAVPFAVTLSLLTLTHAALPLSGFGYAIASGAVASGIGYVIWYSALPGLRSTTAAIVQLSVPILAAVGGIVLLGESLTLRLVLASVAILGGIAMVIVQSKPPKVAARIGGSAAGHRGIR